MTQEPAAHVVREEIQAASAQIVRALQEREESGLEQLANETKIENHIFNWSIGYLLQQDEIEIERENDSFLIRRKKPNTHAAVFI
jgi:hypothetical protein